MRQEVTILPYQDVLLNDRQHFELAVPGGVGSGKTHLFTFWHHTRCLENPKSDSWFVNLNFHLCKHQSMVRYEQMLAELGYVKGQHFTVNKGDLMIEYCFGHRVFFKSAQAWQSWVAVELSHATLDEAASYDDGAYDWLIARVRCPKAKFTQTLTGGAPQGINWFAERYGDESLTPQVIGNEAVYRANERKLVLPYRTYWNTFNRPEYVAQLLDNYAHRPELIKSWIFAEFVPFTEGQCYDAFTTSHIGDYPPDRSNPELHLTWDFNVGMVNWTAVQQSMGKHIAVAENPQRASGTADACRQFLAAFPPNEWGHCSILIHGDASGWRSDTRSINQFGGDYDIIEQALKPYYARLRFEGSNHNPVVTARIEAVNRLFFKQLLYIDRNCTKLIKSLYQTSYDGKGRIAKPRGDDWTHPSDALGYYVCDIAPIIGPNQFQVIHG